ncbi:MAG TPA: efflux RND transporter permease subunit [Pseudolabrys sp.]|nr:efflux RND transporter permease subunit [Pseudolabrys sp.]
MDSETLFRDDAPGRSQRSLRFGTLKNTQQSLTIQAQTELSNADQFRNIIVATRGDRPVRLGELAEVSDSVEDNQTASWYNGTRAILLGVFRQPEANTHLVRLDADASRCVGDVRSTGKSAIDLLS